MFTEPQGPVLADHKHLLCRTLLSRPVDQLHEDLFDLIYRDHTVVAHRTAVEVMEAVYDSNKTVDDVLNGWRPSCLIQ